MTPATPPGRIRVTYPGPAVPPRLVYEQRSHPELGILTPGRIFEVPDKMMRFVTNGLLVLVKDEPQPTPITPLEHTEFTSVDEEGQ